MRTEIVRVIENKYGSIRRNRHRVEIGKLVEIVKLTAYKSLRDYEDVGGFNAFASAIQELLADGYLITIIKPKKYKASFLDAVYWLPATAPLSSGWSEANKLRVHDQGIDLHYYTNHPEKQTTETWTKIERVYDFLRTVKDKEFITTEERSLELFDQEKWLSHSEGQHFLHNLGMTLDSLKAVNSRW